MQKYLMLPLVLLCHLAFCDFQKAEIVNIGTRPMLKFGGRLCVCNRPERLCDIFEVMRKNGIEPKRLRTVHKNPDCAPWLVLVEGKKGAKSFLSIERPLYVRSADGGVSDEMMRIYQEPV